MSEEITLETINSRIDTVISKEDTIIELLNTHTTVLNNILTKVNGLNSSTETETGDEEETTSEFKTQLLEKINEGLPYDQVKQYIIETLTTLGIYSEADIVIKIFTNRLGDIVLEMKTRPHPYFGKVLDFFQQSLEDADKFETSRYTMRIIEWWNLTKNQQMEDQHTTTDIVDEVNEQWGDNDQINFGN